MKITINVDQKASLIAGLEAPTATLTIDIPAANIPEAIRQAIVENLNDDGTLRVPKLGGAPSGYASLPDAALPSVLSNAGETEVIAALETFAAQLDARRVAYDTPCVAKAE